MGNIISLEQYKKDKERKKSPSEDAEDSWKYEWLSDRCEDCCEECDPSRCDKHPGKFNR
jgi:hypothetical protein